MASRLNKIHERAGRVRISLIKRFQTEEKKGKTEGKEKEFSKTHYFSQIENDCIGLECQRQDLANFLCFPLIHTKEEQLQLGFSSKLEKSLVLCGPKNSGKSWLVNRACEMLAEWNIKVIKVDLRTELQTDDYLDDTIRKLFEVAKESGKAIFFLSGIDELFTKQDAVSATLWKKILKVRIAINEEMDKLKVELPIKVIFESRTVKRQLPKTWIHRDHVIDLQMSKQNASHILKSLTEDYRAFLGENLNFDSLAAKLMQRYQPLSVRDLKLLLVDALEKAHDSNIQLSEDDFLQVMTVHKKAKRKAKKQRKRASRTDSEIKRSSEKNKQRKKKHKFERTESGIKRSAEKSKERMRTHRFERTESGLQRSSEKNKQRKKKRKFERTESGLQRSSEKNKQRKKKHKFERTESGIERSAEKSKERMKHLRDSLSTPERRRRHEEQYRKSVGYRRKKRLERYVSNPVPERLQSKRYLNLDENRMAAKRFQMSQYIQRRYGSDEKFRDKQKERDKINRARKMNKSTLANLNVLMGHVMRYQRYRTMSKHKYGDESLCDPMLEAKLSEMENVKQPKGHKARRDKTSLWRQKIEQSIYLDKVRGVSEKELTYVKKQELVAEGKEWLNKVLKKKREQIGHLFVLLKRLKTKHNLAKESIENVTDSQDKEDLLSAFYGKDKHHVYTQEAYGSERVKENYVSLDKLKEENQSDFPENNEEDHGNSMVKEEADPHNIHDAESSTSEQGNIDVNADFTESDVQCFKLLAKFAQEKYSELCTEFNGILHAVDYIEKFFAQKPLTTKSLENLQKKLAFFNEHCMAASQYLNGITYSGDSEEVKFKLTKDRKAMVDSVHKLLEKHDNVSTKLIQIMDLNGDDKIIESYLCLDSVDAVSNDDENSATPVTLNDVPEKSSHLLSPDISIVESGPSKKVVSFYFNPVDSEWQLTHASLLGLSVSSANSMRSDFTESRLIPINSCPSDQQGILPDGNCLFRAVSFIIVGNEDCHQAIRQQVVRFMKENWKKFANMEGCDKTKFDAKMDEMAKNSTWGTWLEILALATLLQTTIYTYIRAEGQQLTWIKYGPLFPSDDLACSDQVIMLDNEARHYEPVFDVEDSLDGAGGENSASSVPLHHVLEKSSHLLLSDYNDEVITTEPVEFSEQVSRTKKADDYANASEDKNEDTLAKRCDCSLPTRWATRLHKVLSTLADLDLPIMKIQDLILAFEECQGCSDYGYPQCRFNATGKCQDNLKFLRSMAPILPDCEHCCVCITRLDAVISG